MHTCSHTCVCVFEAGARLGEPGPAEECLPDLENQSSHPLEHRRGVGSGAVEEGPWA